MSGMGAISLTPFDLVLAATLVVALAMLSYAASLGLARQILIAAARTTVQLLLVGLVLRALFQSEAWPWLAGIASVMLLVAGREVVARQVRPLAGAWGFSVGTLSMFISAFSITVFALVLIINAAPWYLPQYAIPLLGMLLGNTMNGVALGMGRFTETAHRERPVIEGRLLLGQTREEATSDLRRESVRTGMIPILNAMAAAGIVSLPGMMTGQILAGSAPVEAVKYQILIMFLIAAGTGFGVVFSVWLTARRLFDDRHRLRLDRLR